LAFAVVVQFENRIPSVARAAPLQNKFKLSHYRLCDHRPSGGRPAEINDDD
jgi:hypothetical protein